MPFAKEAGYDFNLEELKEYGRNAAKPAMRQLSEDELGAVAGGLCVCVGPGIGWFEGAICTCVAYGSGIGSNGVCICVIGGGG